MKTLYKFTTLLALVLILTACTKEKGANAEHKPQKTLAAEPSGKIAPAFSLQNSHGQTISLADFKGKVILLDFWATWCPPCRQEIPHFIELQSQYGSQGLQVLGISVDQKGWSVVEPFLEQAGINYPTLMYTEAVYNAYQEHISPDQRGGIPFTFILDKQGRIVQQFVGYRDKSVFEEVLKPLLGS